MESVQEIDVQAQPHRGHEGGALADPRDLARACSSRRSRTRPAGPTLEELLSNLPETVDGIRRTLSFLRGGRVWSGLRGTFAGQGSAHDAPLVRRSSERTPPIWSRSLRGELSRRIADAAQPREALARRMSDLRARVAQLPEVSVLLQTGKDKAAMEIVIGFTDTVQSLLALVPFLPPDAERGRTVAELTPVLRDLVAAFDAKDSVLIGDLLEYEIAPRVERLMPLLEQRA